jgi:hypothetical protein
VAEEEKEEEEEEVVRAGGETEQERHGGCCNPDTRCRGGRSAAAAEVERGIARSSVRLSA